MRKLHVFPMLKGLVNLSCFFQYHPIHTLFFLCLPEKHISLQANDLPPLTVSLLRKQAFPSAVVQGNPPSPMRQTPVTLHTVINGSQSKHNSTLPLVICLHFTKKYRGLGVCFQCLIFLPLQNWT